jgi:serine/threonine protein phosphatase PrpC
MITKERMKQKDEESLLQVDSSSTHVSTVFLFVFRLTVGVLAVTRALGDTYMKDYISGHPFTTETILSNTSDEFMILACDGVCSFVSQLIKSSGTSVQINMLSI